MELIREHIHMNKQKCRSALQITLDDDFNVPDVKPDVERIVKEQGIVSIQEITPMNDRFLVRGMLEFNLLYISEEHTRPVNHISGQLPFEEMVNMEGACGEDAIAVKWELDDISTSLINSRKISVKAIVSMVFTAEDVWEEEVAVDVDELEEENGEPWIQYLQKQIPVTQLAVSKKDTYRIKDEIILPSNKENMSELLYSEVTLKEMETRALDEKIGVKGALSIFILYIGEDDGGNLRSFEYELPVSGQLECSGCEDGMIADIEVNLQKQDIQIKPDDDGEERILDLEAILELGIKLYKEEELQILSDIYSTKNHLDIEGKSIAYQNLLIKNDSKLRVVDSLKLETGQPGILQMCNADGVARIDREVREEGSIHIEGVIEIQVLYISDDDVKPVGAVKGAVPFEQQLEIRNFNDNCTYDLKAGLDQLVVTMLSGEEIEVKASVDLNLIVFEHAEGYFIKNVGDGESLEKDRQNMPGITGYIVKDGDTLWDIAKEFYTTVSRIMSINGLDQEKIARGDKLILTKY